MFALEKWRDVEHEILPLMQRAYDALEPYPDMPLDLNVERYAELCAANILHVLTVRIAGVLIGQCLLMIAPSLRNRSHNMAQIDHIWIDAPHRKQGIGAAFLQHIVDYVAGLGAAYFVAASRESDPIDGLLQAHDFVPLERTLIRRM